jgi:hypothetical protein
MLEGGPVGRDMVRLRRVKSANKVRRKDLRDMLDEFIDEDFFADA